MGFIANLFGYVLNIFYNIFNNYGLAIIVFSIILRILLIPITIKQQKSMKKSAQLQEEMKQIQVKYKNNPEMLNQETIALYKREKMSPFSGCFSAIIQLVIILSVFFLVSKPLTHMKKVDPQIIDEYKQQLQTEGIRSSYPEIDIIQRKSAEDENVYINMEFLGLDLSKVPTQSLNDYRVYIIPGLYVISSFISIRLTTKMQTKKRQGETNNDEIDPMEQMNKSMSYMMPIMSISIAVVAPLGLALYWLISNVLMSIERVLIDKFMKDEEE